MWNKLFNYVNPWKKEISKQEDIKPQITKGKQNINNSVMEGQEFYDLSKKQYLQKRLNRMNGYVQFRLSAGIIDYVTIDDSRLYYQPFNKQQTVKTIKDKYQKFTGKELHLSNQNITISQNIPLTELFKNVQMQQTFQTIVQKIQKNEQINKEQIKQSYQAFQKIIEIFKEYEQTPCKIILQNGPGKQIQYNRLLTKDTTFKQLAKQILKHPHVKCDEIQFSSQSTKKYQKQIYDTPFQILQLKEKTIKASYPYYNCFMHGNTPILSFFDDKMQYITLNDWIKSEQKTIYSFNIDNQQIQLNQKSIYQECQVKSFYRLSMVVEGQLNNHQQQSQYLVIEALGNVRMCYLTNDLYEIWKPVKQLKVSDKIVGVSIEQKTMKIYELASIFQIQLENPEIFYAFQVLPSHHFIANNLIIHNSDAFTIKVKQYKQEDKIEETQISFYRNQKLSKFFGNKVCMIAGNILNNNQTFGDYQLQKFNILYVSQEQKRINQRQEFVISQWKKRSVDYRAEINETPFLADKLQKEYMGIYKNKIISLKQLDKFPNQQQNKNVNILVGQRSYFQKLNYLENKQPTYRPLEKHIYEYWNDEKKDNSQWQRVLKKNPQTQKICKKEMLGIFLYTTEDLYAGLNYYLRKQYSQDNQQKEKKHLPVTGWINKSVSKAQNYRGIAYRGMGKIDIRDAFRLNAEQPQQFLIFSAFTSTSLDKNKAMQFYENNKGVNGEGALLTIKVNNGKQISKYSYFPNQKEVLILPFTYFAINHYNVDSPFQTIQLEEIPMPQTTLKKLIFWVDDEPDKQQHKSLIQNEFSLNKGIEVVQVTSTKIMKIILNNFFWTFKNVGRKIVIISDMVRQQSQQKGAQPNYEAGIDLFEHIYKEFGLSNRAILYCSDLKKAKLNLDKRGVQQKNWILIGDKTSLIQEVYNQFDKL